MTDQPPQKRIVSILKQREIGNVDNAIANLQVLLKGYPKLVSGWIELGNSWRIKGDRDKACICYNTGLEIDPNHLWARLQLAQELLVLDKGDAAKFHLKVAVEANPNNPLPLVYLGELELSQQQISIALKWFEKAIALAPTHPEPYLKKVTALRMRQSFNEALSTLEVLFSYHPQHFWGLFQRGKIAQQQGDHPAAMQWFRQAHAIAPNPVCKRDAQLWILEELQVLQRWDEAKSIGADLVACWPQHLLVLQRYGAILRGAGDILEAIAIYEAILDAHPAQHNLLSALVDCAKSLGNTPSELNALKRIEFRVEELWNKNSSLDDLNYCLLRLAERYQQQNDWQTAYTYLGQILERNPHHLWANLNMAIGERNSGDLDAAELRLQQTLVHHPQRIELLVPLGQLERQRQRFDAALGYLQQAAQVKPERWDIHLKIVDVLMESRQFGQARRHLQVLQEQHPNNAHILLQQGLLHKYQGRRGDAFAQFCLARVQVLKQSDNTTLIHQLSWLLIEELRELGQLDRARQEIDSTIAAGFQEHSRTQLLLASILQCQQMWELAVTIYQKMLQKQPDQVQATIELARCWSQSGQVTKAIALLHDYTQNTGQHPGVLLLLAHIHQSLDEFDQAQKWYEIALESSPHHPDLYCGLAECLFQKGQFERSCHTLVQSQKILPYVVQIPIKLAQLLQRQGKVEQSHGVLVQAREVFSEHVPLMLALSQLHIRCGQFTEAIALLDTLHTDHQGWCKRILNQRGDIALRTFQLEQAETYYNRAIALHPPQQEERLQLAHIHLLQGKLDVAYDCLDQSTQDLGKKLPLGQVRLPLKSLTGAIINEFRVNPLRLEQLQHIQKEEDGHDRILALAAIVLEEPTYLGAVIHVAKELYLQNIWQSLRASFAIRQPHTKPIPKRIIQFWDEPEPPPDIQHLGQTWQEHHPDYEYKRFSLKDAIAFLQQHYTPEIIEAFCLCRHPAAQSDFFRLAYLNCYGGFYTDVDDLCRQSLEPLRQSTAELILYHEAFACFGNNFLGSVPYHPMVRSALYQAAANLLNYCAEGAWSQTGPGVLTSAVINGLLPYIAGDDYRLWPRLLVLSYGELSAYAWTHMPLSYKQSEKAWQNQAFPKTWLAQSH